MVARRTWYPCAYNAKTEWGVWKSPWFSSCGTLTRETSHTMPDSEFYNCELINMSFFFKKKVCSHCDITKENQDKQCELFFHLIKIGLEIGSSQQSLSTLCHTQDSSLYTWSKVAHYLIPHRMEKGKRRDGQTCKILALFLKNPR